MKRLSAGLLAGSIVLASCAGMRAGWRYKDAIEECRQGDYERCTDSYTQALELNPELGKNNEFQSGMKGAHASLYLRSANRHLSRKNWDDAARDFKKVFNYSPQHSESLEGLKTSYYLWGQELFGQKLWSKSIDKFNQALGVDPNFADAKTAKESAQDRIVGGKKNYEAGLINMDGKNWDAALDSFRKAAELDPSIETRDVLSRTRGLAAEEWCSRGEAILRDGNFPQAISAYRGSFKYIQNYGNAVDGINRTQHRWAEKISGAGDGLFKQGKIGDAEKSYFEALDHFRDLGEALSGLAKIHVFRGRLLNENTLALVEYLKAEQFVSGSAKKLIEPIIKTVRNGIGYDVGIEADGDGQIAAAFMRDVNSSKPGYVRLVSKDIVKALLKEHELILAGVVKGMPKEIKSADFIVSGKAGKMEQKDESVPQNLSEQYQCSTRQETNPDYVRLQNDINNTRSNLNSLRSRLQSAESQLYSVQDRCRSTEQSYQIAEQNLGNYDRQNHCGDFVGCRPAGEQACKGRYDGPTSAWYSCVDSVARQLEPGRNELYNTKERAYDNKQNACDRARDAENDKRSLDMDVNSAESSLRRRENDLSRTSPMIDVPVHCTWNYQKINVHRSVRGSIGINIADAQTGEILYSNEFSNLAESSDTTIQNANPSIGIQEDPLDVESIESLRARVVSVIRSDATSNMWSVLKSIVVSRYGEHAKKYAVEKRCTQARDELLAYLYLGGTAPDFGECLANDDLGLVDKYLKSGKVEPYRHRRQHSGLMEESRAAEAVPVETRKEQQPEVVKAPDKDVKKPENELFFDWAIKHKKLKLGE